MTRSFFVLLADEAAELLAHVGTPDSVPTLPGQSVFMVLPGDREAVYQRLYDAVGVWLVRTPPIKQSAASLSRFLMGTLESGEVPTDDGP